MTSRLIAILLSAAVLALTLTTGCHRSERRQTTVIEEQHESEVIEQAPGEMIVE